MWSWQRISEWTPWCLLVLATALTVSLSWRSTRPFPFMDEYALTDAIAAEELPPWSWFWRQHNEHRIPLPKLALVTIGKWTDANGQIATLVSVLLAAGSATMMLLMIRKLRGSTQVWDAAVPLTFLHLAHGQTLIEPFQLHWTIPVFLACSSAWLAVCNYQKPRLWRDLALGLCILGLPLSGGMFLPTAAGSVIVFSFMAWKRWQSQLWYNSVLVGCFGLLVAGVTIAYTIHLEVYEHVPNQEFATGSKLVVKSAEVISTAVGVPFATDGDSVILTGSRRHPRIVGAIVALVLASGIFGLISTMVRDRNQWELCLWLGLHITGLLASAVLIGYARSWTTLAARYSILFAPLIPLAIASLVFLPRPRWTRIGTVTLCGMVILAALKNYRTGDEWLDERRQENAHTIATLKSSESIEEFSEKIPLFVDRDMQLQWLKLLAEHRLSTFRHIDPPPQRDTQQVTAAAHQATESTRVTR